MKLIAFVLLFLVAGTAGAKGEDAGYLWQTPEARAVFSVEPCNVVSILERIREEFRDQFKTGAYQELNDGFVRGKGVVVPFCWIEAGGALHTIDVNGALESLPLSDPNLIETIRK